MFPPDVTWHYPSTFSEAAIHTGEADLVAFGALFLANPDLVERFKQGAPLNTPDTHPIPRPFTKAGNVAAPTTRRWPTPQTEPAPLPFEKPT